MRRPVEINFLIVVFVGFTYSQPAAAQPADGVQIKGPWIGDPPGWKPQGEMTILREKVRESDKNFRSPPSFDQAPVQSNRALKSDPTDKAEMKKVEDGWSLWKKQLESAIEKRASNPNIPDRFRPKKSSSVTFAFTRTNGVTNIVSFPKNNELCTAIRMASGNKSLELPYNVSYVEVKGSYSMKSEHPNFQITDITPHMHKAFGGKPYGEIIEGKKNTAPSKMPVDGSLPLPLPSSYWKRHPAILEEEFR